MSALSQRLHSLRQSLIRATRDFRRTPDDSPESASSPSRGRLWRSDSPEADSSPRRLRTWTPDSSEVVPNPAPRRGRPTTLQATTWPIDSPRRMPQPLNITPSPKGRPSVLQESPSPRKSRPGTLQTLSPRTGRPNTLQTSTEGGEPMQATTWPMAPPRSLPLREPSPLLPPRSLWRQEEGERSASPRDSPRQAFRFSQRSWRDESPHGSWRDTSPHYGWRDQSPYHTVRDPSPQQRSWRDPSPQQRWREPSPHQTYHNRQDWRQMSVYLFPFYVCSFSPPFALFVPFPIPASASACTVAVTN